MKIFLRKYDLKSKKMMLNSMDALALSDAEEEFNQQIPVASNSYHGSRSPSITQPTDDEVVATDMVPSTSTRSLVTEQQSEITPMSVDVGPDWQAEFKSVRQRNAVMFNSELMADVHFIVGEDKLRVPAHKYILATGSSVFFAMFYGGLASDDTDIAIPDVEANAFLNLLRYLYYDEVKLEADTVLATLYGAKKYMVPHLARRCVDFLEKSLNSYNACMLLFQSRLFEETDLTNRCWEVIDAQAKECLQSDGFLDIEYNTFQLVVSRETLNVDEIHVFHAALKWAAAECKRREIVDSAKNKRTVLGDALHEIRLPAMKLEEFANHVANSGLLTLKETTEIFLYYTAKEKPIIDFVTYPRRGLLPKCCHRFQSTAYRSNQWRYRGRCDSIMFSADSRIFIAGYGLYGSSNGAADYRIKMELKCKGVTLGSKTTSFFSDGSSTIFPVYFNNPIQLEAHKNYTASVILDGQELSYFGQGGFPEARVDNVTFSFQCSSDSTNGTGVQGGQIPEIIFYC